MVEQCPVKAEVTGSSPAPAAIRATIANPINVGIYVWKDGHFAEVSVPGPPAKSWPWYHNICMGPVTRIRLASAPQGDLGKWERVDRLRGFARTHQLAHIMPPECVAPSGRKLRSHRRGLSIYTLFEAMELDKDRPWLADEDKLRWLLDQPTETIEAIANMKRLARLAASGGV